VTLEELYPIDEVRRFLQQSGASPISEDLSKLPTVLKKDSGEKWLLPVNWRLTKEIVVRFGELYPDELPKIYLTSEFTIGLIPHVDQNLFVCSLRSDITINPDNPVGVLRECLLGAQGILDKEWTELEIQEHVESELKAYWPIQNGDLREIFYVPNILDKRFLWIEQPNYKSRIHKVVPLDDRGSAHQDGAVGVVVDVPSADILALLKSPHSYLVASADAKDAIGRLGTRLAPMSRNIKRTTLYIFFRCRLPKGDRILGAYSKQKLPIKRKTADEISSLLYRSMNDGNMGFCRVQDIGFERLIKRSQGTKVPNLSGLRIAIVGCGSLGSFLAESLARSGICKYFLCDSELLQVENLGRHACNIFYTDMNKALAVRAWLKHRFEDIEITVSDTDFRLTKTLEALEKFSPDLTIFATGSTNSDLTASRLVARGVLKTSCYVWAETDLVAGHLIFQPQGTESLLLNLHSIPEDKGQYAHRVNKNVENNLEQEAGCQTIYSPYSGNDMALFASMVAKCIVSWILDSNKAPEVLRVELKSINIWGRLYDPS